MTAASISIFAAARPKPGQSADRSSQSMKAPAGWTPIAVPDSSLHYDHSCCWDPVHDMVYMVDGGMGTCYRYNAATGGWSEMASLPHAREWVRAVYCRGKLYTMGGLVSPREVATDSCEVYDIARDSWSAIASMPLPDYACAGFTWRDSLIYVLGGGGPKETGVDTVQVYNPLTNAWSIASSLPQPCYLSDAGIIGDTIYFAGGLNVDQLAESLLAGGIDPNQPTRIKWSFVAPLPSPRFAGPTLAMRGRIYWFGGRTSFFDSLGTNRGYVFTPRTGTIDSLPLYPYRASYNWSTADDSLGRIYCIGGELRAPHDRTAAYTLQPDRH
jgi:hypothetical protein